MIDKNDYDLDPIDRAVYETVHDYTHPQTGRKGARALAPLVGMSPSTLSNKANPNEGFAHLSLQESRQLMLATGDTRIAKALAADLGMACYPLPSTLFTADMDLLAAWANWQEDVADTVHQIQLALKTHDGRIVASDIASVRASLIHDYEKGLAILDVLKGMADEPIPDDEPVLVVMPKRTA